MQAPTSRRTVSLEATMASGSPVLAGPVSDCCVKGFKYEGEPVGRRETISGLQTYVSDPPASTTGSKKVILFLSDVYGAFYINSQLLQDFFASQGFYVLGVDYFEGDYIQNHAEESGFNLAEWVHERLGNAQQITPGWIDAVIDIHGKDATYFCVGYCFGGPFTLELVASDKVAAGAFAHPAFLTEDHFRNVKKPLLLSCAEYDRTFPNESRQKAEDILAEIKATYHVQIFSGTTHGFVTRGDITDPSVRWAKEQSAQAIANWFKRFAPET